MGRANKNEFFNIFMSNLLKKQTTSFDSLIVLIQDLIKPKKKSRKTKKEEKNIKNPQVLEIKERTMRRKILQLRSRSLGDKKKAIEHRQIQ